MPDQINLSSLPSNTGPTGPDRMLIWPSTVNSSTDLKYITYETIVNSVATAATPTVQANLAGAFIGQPGSPSGNQILYYNGSSWVGTATVPTNAVVQASIADNAVGTAELATGAVTDIKVASGINGSKISDGTIADAKLSAGIAGSKLTDNTVAGGKIISLDAAKITGPGVIPSSTLLPNIPISKITGPSALPINLGGTSATSATGALTALKGYGAPNETAQGRRIFIQTADPTTVAGGSYTLADGDIWFKV